MASTLKITEADVRRVYTVGAVPTTDFAIPWPFFELRDVTVLVGGVLMVRGTDYDITAVEAEDLGYLSGTVQMVAPVSSTTVIVERETPRDRQSDFPRGSSLSIDVLNRDLDRLTAIAQELAFRLGRAIRLPQSDVSDPSLYLPALPAERAGRLIGFDATGENIVTALPAEDITILSDPSKVPMTRRINAGVGLSGGGDLSADRTLSLASSGVTPGTYNLATVTVDTYGRVTAAATGSAVAGSVPTTRSITTSAPLSGGGTLAADVNIGMADSGVSPGTYQNATVTVDAKGRVTAIASNPSGVDVPQSRTITTTDGITGGGDLSANRTIGLTATGVTAGTYARATITVDDRGRITSASANSAGGGALPVIDVTDYGAVGDGSTDDTSAVNSAVAALSDSGSVLFFPVGTYRLTSAVNIDKQNVVVRGDGENVSRILQAHNGVGLYLKLQGVDQNMPVHRVEGLTFMQANGNNGGTPLRIENTTPAYSEMAVSIRKVAIRGYEVHTAGTAFGTGIHLVNVGFINLEEVKIWGHDDGGAAASEYGIRWQITDSTARFGFFGHKLSITNMGRGISLEGPVEGIYMNAGEIWECREGIVIDRTGFAQSGGISITGFHINAGVRMIDVISASAILINGNDLYHGCAAPSLQNLAGSAVRIDSSNKVVLSNNTIQSAFNPGAGFQGIVMDDVDDFSVTGNILQKIPSAQVWCQGGSTNGLIMNNVMDAVLTAYTPTGVTIASGCSGIIAKNNLLKNIDTPVAGASADGAYGVRGCLVYKSGNFSQTSGTVSWDAEVYDTDAIWSSGDGLTVPAGVCRVRVTAGIGSAGDGSGDGTMLANITKNGSGGYAGEPREGQYVNSLASKLTVNLSSPVLEVSPGDVFRLAVAINNGNWQGDRTWMAMEIIE